MRRHCVLGRHHSGHRRVIDPIHHMRLAAWLGHHSKWLGTLKALLGPLVATCFPFCFCSWFSRLLGPLVTTDCNTFGQKGHNKHERGLESNWLRIICIGYGSYVLATDHMYWLRIICIPYVHQCMCGYIHVHKCVCTCVFPCANARVHNLSLQTHFTEMSA